MAHRHRWYNFVTRSIINLAQFVVRSECKNTDLVDDCHVPTLHARVRTRTTINSCSVGAKLQFKIQTIT